MWRGEQVPNAELHRSSTQLHRCSLSCASHIRRASLAQMRCRRVLWEATGGTEGEGRGGSLPSMCSDFPDFRRSVQNVAQGAERPTCVVVFEIKGSVGEDRFGPTALPLHPDEIGRARVCHFVITTHELLDVFDGFHRRSN